jgi:hypothetical protein
MRKKTAPTPRRQPAAAAPVEGGLIAQGRADTPRSAGDALALDNRSHRTIFGFSGAPLGRHRRIRSAGRRRIC